MTDKELRRLKRAELLEILYYLQKENEELKAEIELLKTKPSQNISGLPDDFMEQIRTMIQETVSRSSGNQSKPSGNKKKHR